MSSAPWTDEQVEAVATALVVRVACFGSMTPTPHARQVARALLQAAEDAGPAFREAGTLTLAIADYLEGMHPEISPIQAEHAADTVMTMVCDRRRQ